MTRLGYRLALIGALLVVVAGVLPALAQEGGNLEIREAVLDDDGSTTVTVSVTGLDGGQTVPLDGFTVLENGSPVEGVEVERLSESAEAEPIVVLVALDVSGSTAGEPLSNAQVAAQSFVNAVLQSDVQVGLVTFGDEAELLVPPTTDGGPLNEAIDQLEAEGETSLNDAIVVAARTLQNFQGQRSIVVFSDGADTVSQASIETAVTAVDAVGASVTTVALETEDLDLAALERLAASSGGRVVTVTDAASLDDAFGTVAASLTDQFVLTYDGFATGADEIDLAVTLVAGAVELQDQARVLSPRTAATAGEPRVVSVAEPDVFGTETMLYVALGVTFAGAVLFLFVLLVPRGDRRVSRTLQRGMRMYNRGGSRAAPSDATTRLASSSVTQSAVRMVSRVPRPRGYDEKVQLKLDRAGWPLRSTEFTAMRVLGTVLAFGIAWGLLGNLILAAVTGAVVALLPGVLLDGRVTSRQNQFLTQLPDTLQLLAGALKAGYGIMQAVDTVVKEAPEPTASEFSRVLSESRLGLPLEDSLESMADRVGSEDFRWVVVAINIQRRVGGNLAELLDTVAETLREREMVRRQIKTLSAEGRLSAIILASLPFVIGLYLFVVNRGYLNLLFERTVGQLMLAGAAVLMGLGVLWMRKLIDIDV